MTLALKSKNRSTLARFLDTQAEESDEEALLETLIALRPDRLSTSDLLEIVEWIEDHSPAEFRLRVPHVSIFGTGGDQTVNISTPAAIIASHFVPVQKVGTHGVTSNYGSVDFVDSLLGRLATEPNPVLRERAWFAPGSRYLRLGDLGFPYRDCLRNARRRLWKLGIPDLYKVVFPFANYTDPAIQINGCGRPVYRDLYTALAVQTRRNVWIVHSELDIDELTPGKNELRFVNRGQIAESTVKFGTRCSSAEVRRELRERPTANEHVDLFLDLLRGQASPEFTETLCWNAALLVHARGSQTLFECVELIREYVREAKGSCARDSTHVCQPT